MSNTSLTTKVSQSRGWTLALGIAAAALAAILLIAYLVQYRSSVNDSTAPTPVLVAKNLIPKGTSGHRHRREAALPGRDPREGRPQGRRDLRSGVPERPRRRRGHLSRPADHDGRPECGLDRRDPDAALRKAARCCDPGIGARGLVGYVASGDRVDIYYETGSTGGTVLGLLAPNVLVMRAPVAEGSPAILRADAATCPERSPWRPTPARCGSSCAPRATRRTPRRSRSRARSSSPRSTDRSRRPWNAPSAHSSPSKASTPSTSSGPCPTTPTSSSSGSRTGSTRRSARCRAVRSTSSSSPARAARTTGRSRSSTASTATRPTCRSSCCRRPRRTGSCVGRSTPARRTWRSSRSRRSSSASR